MTGVQTCALPILKGDINSTTKYNVAGTEKILAIKSEYITVSADALKLSNGLARFYKYSDFAYGLTSDADFEPGAYVTLTETKSGLSGEICRVVQRIDNAYTGYSKYILEGVEEYATDTVTTDSEHIQPPVDSSSEDNYTAIQTRPTYTEIATTGFTAGGGTTTPTQVAILESRGEFKASILKWDRQNDLTNFDKYQIQVSEDRKSVV